jgi:hypothetical protein
MNIQEMRLLVRRDLHDEVEANYRWTDDELDRHIVHALKDFSEAIPLEQKSTLSTTSGLREISLAGLIGPVRIEALEYPLGCSPPSFPRFSVCGDVLTIHDGRVPDGSDCRLFWYRLHSLDASQSTLPVHLEELVIAGACAYAAVQLAVDSINKINAGGSGTTGEWSAWGANKLNFFRSELKRLGRKNKVRVKQLYQADNPTK